MLLAIFNMIPLNPLDGGRVLGIFLPNKVADFLMVNAKYNIFILLGIIFILPSLIGTDILFDYYIEPLFTLFAAFVFLGELLMPLQFVGALIIVGALTASGLAGLKNNN